MIRYCRLLTYVVIDTHANSLMPRFPCIHILILIQTFPKLTRPILQMHTTATTTTTTLITTIVGPTPPNSTSRRQIYYKSLRKKTINNNFKTKNYQQQQQYHYNVKASSSTQANNATSLYIIENAMSQSWTNVSHTSTNNSCK